MRIWLHFNVVGLIQLVFEMTDVLIWSTILQLYIVIKQNSKRKKALKTLNDEVLADRIYKNRLYLIRIFWVVKTRILNLVSFEKYEKMKRREEWTNKNQIK